MTKRYKRAVLIGRFEPLHKGHLSNFIQALDIADEVIILVGSSYQPRTPKNPFKFPERREILEQAIAEELANAKYDEDVTPACFTILPIRDFKYSNNSWIRQVQTVVNDTAPGVDDKEICILGYNKDDSSWYNHAFPAWDFIPLRGFVEHGSIPIDATKIRELYFEGHMDYIHGAVPSAVFQFLKSFSKRDEYKLLVEEYEFYKSYKKMWEAAPYPVIFHTSDAVVLQGGHILLIQRKHSPGKGLWALPGGFLNPKETLEDGCIRELREETCIKIPEVVLRKGITYEKMFDHPDRSLRGRTITQAYLLELDGGNGELARVKGKDDALKAKWFTLAEVDQMEEVIFEDHKHIIATLVARAKK
jgi:bifunctional NMN adenylyltransferase/nudix hydrolase